MKIKRRFPNFFTVDDSELTENEINSLEELLEVEWVKHYSKHSTHIGMFYSPKQIEYGGEYPDLLMHLFQSGNRISFFVVGYIFGNGKDLGLEDYNEYLKNNGDERADYR